MVTKDLAKFGGKATSTTRRCHPIICWMGELGRVTGGPWELASTCGGLCPAIECSLKTYILIHTYFSLNRGPRGLYTRSKAGALRGFCSFLSSFCYL